MSSRRPLGALLALALLVQLCLVLQIAVVGQPAAADPLPPGPPTSVTLSTDKSVISAGESATLTASVDTDLAATASVLTVRDQTTNATLKTCTTGTTCSVATTFATGGPHTYVAKVNTLVSGEVSISRAPWTVSLSIDKAVFNAGEQPVLTATADQNVGSTGGNYRIWIKDTTTGVVLGSCTTGTTCSRSTVFYTGGPHD